ncbi:sensory histidine-kinase / response regulator [Legionella moravica]|uniref:Sensory box histidine kinase/response regulator n=1 Tax=Legionella moravica TaxID=39962 RepID=A0A378JX75_9GAMM|nr:response regulator [Legionella moravica]KTD35423.1 sensory histidine-kinase / response regulator [Legionella moravica]STX62008.1 sensory box histidine kinase/response regulator [Legionella moravica]
MTKHILVVEDNHIASKMQKIILEGMGFEVDCAMTGEEGVDLALNKKYDLIIMDIGLPGIDGIESTIKIRMDQSRINNTLTPIVAVTANEEPLKREQCLEAGMDDVFSKPFTPETARELVARFFPEVAA